MSPTIAKNQLRQSFFEYLFEDDRGYLCLAVADRGDDAKMKTSFRRIFFEWPLAKNELRAFIDENLLTKHLWFSVHLFSRAKALKENAVSGRIVYADLDECDPTTVEPKPSIATETSPGHYQAIWKLNAKIPPEVAADYSRRVAYKYSDNGADLSGWDIGQLLRVPYTKNFKYARDPEVDVRLTARLEGHAETFEAIEKPITATEDDDEVDESMPKLDELPPYETIVYKFARELQSERVMDWHDEEPDANADWSAIMWRLINTCLEIGMSVEETFAVAATSKCNKYERDRRPIRLLWREVLKANQKHINLGVALDEQALLTMPEIALEPATTTILDQYQEWAREATDALPIYHELAGFMVLSAILSPNLRLETQYGTMVPNLWGLILGESTLTRKTTAMEHAKKLLNYLDQSIIIGSEGSVEGLLQELSTRPRLASMFYRDEISGFLDAVIHKDYLAGMTQQLIQLYDAPEIYTRLLKRERIAVQDPIFLFFGGGVTEDVYSVMDASQITSGFLPRFLIVSGFTNPEGMQPTGRPSNENLNRRNAIYEVMARIYHDYNQTKPIKIGNETIQRQPNFVMDLTDEAWDAFQIIEKKLTMTAYESSISRLAQPTFGRLIQSCLKMSMLLAAARQEPELDTTLLCEKEDVVNAASYIQRWGRFSIEMMYNAGKSESIRLLERVRDHIRDNPGIIHSTLMRKFHLHKRQMDEAINTLYDRGEIQKVRKQGKGGGITYWPL